MNAAPLVLHLLQTVSAVKLFVPPSYKAWLGTNVQIPCSFTVDRAPVQRSLLEIIWYFQGQQVLRVDDKSEKIPNPRLSYVDRAWDGGADLFISNPILSDGGLYKCAVIYGSKRKEGEVRLDIQAPPQVTITGKTVVMNTTSVLRCSITGFFPVDIDVKWFRGAERLNDVTVETPRRNQDGLYNVNSSVMIIPSEEDREQNFSCTVQHESLQQLHQEIFQLSYGAVPTIHILPHTFIKNVEQILVCHITGFYPESIVVNWFLNGTCVMETETKRINSSALDLVFNFMPTEENWGMEVSCVVEHESLLRPQVKSLTVLGKDLKANHKRLVVMAAILLSVIFGAGTIFFYMYTYKQKHLMSSPELGEILTPTLMLNSQAQLQCTISHYYPNSLTVNWIRKVMGNEEIIGTSEKYKITPRRSQHQRDKTFTCTAGLVLTPSREDQGSEIICRVTHPSLEQPVERSTGQIQVWVKPTIDCPIQLSINNSGDVTASLSLVNFYPKDIMITWTYGQSQEKKPSEESSTENPDGTFSIDTKCVTKIPEQLFIEKCFYVKVTWKHETMDKAECREMFVGHPDFPWCPRIVSLSPLIVQIGIETTLTCKVSKFFPNNLTVTWHEKTRTSIRQCMAGIYNMSCTLERAADNSYSCSASLSFTAQSQSDDLEYICNVSHPSLKNPIERSTGKAKRRVIPETERQVKLTLSDLDKVKCSIMLTNFYPSNITFTWTNKENKPISSKRKLIQTDDEQTFDATSECTVPWKYFTSGVRVTWEHESLTSPQYRDLHVTDFPWHPVIGEIDRPAFYVSTEATLQCKISQYFPSDLTVTWYMKRKTGNVDVTDNTTSIAQRQPDNTYSCTACLTFTPSVREHDGAEIICRVQHPTLRKYIEKSTGPIQVYASPRMQDNIQWSLITIGKGLCSLKLQTFYPKPIEINWSCSSSSCVKSCETYEDNPDSTVNVRSDCTVTQENFTDPIYRIIVTWRHQSLTEPQKREIYIRDSGPPCCFRIREIITPVLLLTEEVNLHCDISGYFPDKLTMTWLVRERGWQNYIPADQLKKHYQIKTIKKPNSDTGSQSTTSLRFRPSQFKHHGSKVMCMVQHPILELPIQRTSGLLLMPLNPEVKKPISLTLSNSENVNCSIYLDKFYPSNIKINWTNKEDNEPISTRNLITTDYEHTFHATSECTVPWKYFTSGVRVTWEHESLTSPQYQDLHVTDFPWRPVIEEMDIPDFHETTEATLQCNISRYFPNDLTVTWYIKKKWDTTCQIDNPAPIAQRQPNNTYSCTACLTFTPSVREHDGAEIICRVQHPTLGKYIEKTTGPIKFNKMEKTTA